MDRWWVVGLVDASRRVDDNGGHLSGLVGKGVGGVCETRKMHWSSED